MERKLAHIEEISALTPILGADKIEVAHVLGWECVVKKGEFSVGDLVVYVEVDSVMPETKEYEFLKERKYRVRTIRLRGQISQGLVLPLSALPKDYKKVTCVGDDVTEAMGVKKYLTPTERQEIESAEKAYKKASKTRKFLMRYSFFRSIFGVKKTRIGFPYWVSKTDEERIQNMPNALTDFAEENVYMTEKIDYQSVTFTGKRIARFEGFLGRILPKKYVFVVCSRNFAITDKNTLYWRIAKKYRIEEILRKNPTLTIQGEQGDTKVQGNKYGIKEPRLWVFNIIDHERNYHYDVDEISRFCEENNLEMVPILTRYMPLWVLGKSVQEMVSRSEGYSLINHNIPREGIVIRCIKDGKKLLSFKVINPDFLLKYDN